MSNESAKNTLWWLLVPIVVALAAIYWLTAIEGWHGFNRQLTQESRQAEAVGEKQPPRAPLKITIKNDVRQCVKIESAHFDGDDLWLMMRRECGKAGDYEKLHWRLKALDGTVVNSGWTNNGFNDMDSGERQEYKPYDFKMDPRATELILTTSGL